MAGESWKGHKITGREAAWDADHAEQLIELQVERSGECLDCGQTPCVVQAIHGVPCRELVR